MIEVAEIHIDPKLINLNAKAGAEAFRPRISPVPTQLITKHENKIKRTSPICEIVKTFSPALRVVTLIDQYLIKKNETMLIISHSASMLIRSAETKNNIASCENAAERSTIFGPNASYSKYSLRKAKHTTNAMVKMAIKEADSPSKPRSIGMGGVTPVPKVSQMHNIRQDPELVIEVAVSVENINSPNSDAVQTLRSDLKSNQRQRTAQNPTIIKPCMTNRLSIL